jgi:PAS domain S-box-containing protein
METFKVVLGILFGLMVAAIAILGVYTYQNNNTLIETSMMVSHTHEVMDQSETIASLYKDLQLESNAFLISRDSARIVAYNTAKESISPAVEKLRRLTRDDSIQQSRIDSLEIQLLQLIKFSDAAFEPVGQSLESRIGRNIDFRNNIRAWLDEIRNEELVLLSPRESANEESIRAFRNTFFLFLGVISVLLVTTFFAIRYNFNKRIRIQKELKKANDLFFKLFHETPIGIVISRAADGVIIDCNKAYERLIGFGRRELIGKTAAELNILDLNTRDSIVRTTREKGLIRDVEVQLKPKSGPLFWTSISMQYISVDDHECLLSVVLDITTHKRAEEDIKKALNAEIELNRMKSNFITLASHEFRTPLTTILSSAFLLENYAVGDNVEKIRKHLLRIKASVTLLTSILDEFLSLSKIEEGGLRPHMEKLNLKQYLEALCQNLQTFSKPGQRIEYKHQGADEAYTDRVLLGNIVNNLVSNAVKYSPENTTIEVSSVVNKKLHLVVKDCGIGISEADQKHLFKRFYRASNAGNVQGTGLGLHIMKHYVDVLGGSIALQSEPGKGSEFQVTFDAPHEKELNEG